MKSASPLLWISLYPQFLPCLYKLMIFSSIIVLCIYIRIHMHICVYEPTELCSYVHVFRTDHLRLDNLCGSFSLEEMDSPYQQALTSCSYLGEAYGISPARIVMWTGVVIVLILQATILLRVHEYSISVMCRRYHLTAGLTLTLEIFLPSLPWFSLSPRNRYCIQCIN